MHAYARYLLFALITLLLLYLGFHAYTQERHAVQITQQISGMRDTSASIQRKLDSLLESLSAGLYDNYSQHKSDIEAMEREATQAHRNSILYLYYFYAATAIFLLLFYLLDFELLILFTGTAALISLTTALFAPLVLMTVYKTFPIIGEVTLSYESKSIYTTITKLFTQHNYLIALLVLLFSVMIPLLKALVLIGYGFFKESGIAKQSVVWIEKIGKWSMADVFIVALLVVLFSTRQDIHTSLKVEVGLYFFAGYVMLSMLGSTLLALKRKP